MARPREFNEEEALDQALAVFWTRGFKTTSMGDISSATGLVKSSLYGAFGDKRALFQRALDRYLERFAELELILNNASSARLGIGSFFARWLELCHAPSGPRGCFVQLSAADGPEASAVAEEAAAKIYRQLQKTLARSIERGQKSGELGREPGAEKLAEMLLLLFQGISIASRTGSRRAELERTVESAIALL